MENRAQVEHRVSERKSSSSSYSAASKQSSSRTHTDGSRNGKSNRISPKTGINFFIIVVYIPNT